MVLLNKFNKEFCYTHFMDIQSINSKIYTIRGKQVMLDRDLMKLYGIKSIRLRELIKRNKERFPEDFMFQLTDLEINFMMDKYLRHINLFLI